MTNSAMEKKAFFTFTFSLVWAMFLVVHAQESDPVRLSGVLVDSTGAPIPKANIRLFSISDTLFATSKDDGTFIFNSIKAKTLRLEINHISYISGRLQIVMPDNRKSLDIGKVTLHMRTVQLKEISVENIPKVTFRGDTIDFETEHIALDKGAFLEELMDRLPGMHVDQYGNLIFMGEPVKKARINGIDFFGGDIVLALKNLPADLINRLQLIDDYGPDAALTGIREGVPSKVLNLLVDDDKNKGLFTQGTGSYGIQDRYIGQGSINYFNKSRQLSIKAGQNNMSLPATEGGRAIISTKRSNNIGSDDHSNGLNTAGAIDILYSDQWFDRIDVPFGYRTQRVHNNVVSKSDKVQQFDQNRVTQTQNSRIRNVQDVINEFRGSLNGKRFTIKSSSGRTTLAFSPEIRTTRHVVTESETSLLHFMENQQLKSVESTTAIRNQSNDIWIAGTDLYITQQLNRVGRTLSFSGGYEVSEDHADDDQIVRISIREGGAEDSRTDVLTHLLTDRNTKDESFKIGTRLTELIGEKHLIYLDLSYNQKDGDAWRAVYDGAAGMTQIDSFSTQTQMRFGQTRALIGIQKKVWQGWRYDASLVWTRLNLSSRYGSVAKARHQKGSYWIPNISLQHTSSESRFSMQYNWRVQQPTLDQLDPIGVYSDPRLVSLGNPDLAPSLTHQAAIQWMTMGVVKGRALGINLNGYYTQRNITPDIQLIQDDVGMLRQEIRYRNLSGDFSLSGKYNYSRTVSIVERFSCQIRLEDEVTLPMCLTGVSGTR